MACKRVGLHRKPFFASHPQKHWLSRAQHYENNRKPPPVEKVGLTGVWTELLSRKGYHDLTGNGVNHPNDFGHRLYAQVILGLLVDPR